MHGPTLRWIAATFLLFGCNGGSLASDSGTGGIDSGRDIERDGGAPSDAETSADSGPSADSEPRPDSGPSPDSGPPVCMRPEGPPPHPGCHPEMGIECDGDWRGINPATGSEFCAPACSPDQCCTPQGGRFVCQLRDGSGSCPAADLFVDADQITGDYEVVYRTFDPADCAIVEGCVAGPGRRRLLRFDTWTPNVGTADMFLGLPSMDSPHFEHSSCHNHYHFNSYAEYELLSADGECVVATGHKQAFCLLDFYRYPGMDGSGAMYTCDYQGIQRNWQDVYSRDLDCQWVDVTDVPPGEYQLRIRVNTEHILNETNYANNEIVVPVSITDDPGVVSTDITAPCAPRAPMGLGRSCGFTRAYDGACTAGSMVSVGCSAACGLGSCTGDSIMRVCETALGVNCDVSNELTSNDDSGCGGACDAAGGDCCSRAQFTCPGTGRYTVWTAPYQDGDPLTCTIAAM